MDKCKEQSGTGVDQYRHDLGKPEYGWLEEGNNRQFTSNIELEHLALQASNNLSLVVSPVISRTGPQPQRAFEEGRERSISLLIFWAVAHRHPAHPSSSALA